MSRKLTHKTPQLKEIITLLQSDATKSKELTQLIENTRISEAIFKVENEYRCDKFQNLELHFTVALGGESTKKPAKKRVKTEATTETKWPSVSFIYVSEWGQERYEGQGRSAKLNMVPTNEEEEEDEEEINKVKTSVLSLSGEENALWLTIRWSLIERILATLHCSLDPAHFLEVLRCCLFYNKSTRVAPDKWNLPRTKPPGVDKQDIPHHILFNKKVKVTPTTKEGVQEFVNEQVTKLTEQLTKLCEKIETCTCPVYVQSVFIHSSKLVSETREHQIVVDVVIVVEQDLNDGSIKTSPEHKQIVPILKAFDKEKRVYEVYRDYRNLPAYLPQLVREVPNITDEEHKRLLPIYHTWLNHLSHWDDIKDVKNIGYPWSPIRLVAHLLKCNLNIKIDLRTEDPPTRPKRATRSNAAEVYYTHLWSVGTDKTNVPDIITKELEPTAKEIVQAFRT